MSWAKLLKVHPGESAEPSGIEFRNSWGTQPVIWQALADLYLKGSYHEDPDKLWALIEDSRIPVRHRAVLGMTFDGMYIVKRDYAKAASHIETFLEEPLIKASTIGKFNHWPAIAWHLKRNPEYPAIALQVSVADFIWEGEYDKKLAGFGPVTDWSNKYSLYDDPYFKDDYHG